MRTPFQIARLISSVLLIGSLGSGILIISKTSAHSRETRTGEASTATYPALAAYATDLTELAHQGKLGQVNDHDKAIQQIARVLSRDHKNNPVLIAEPGFGRSIIIAGLAYRIASGDVPNALQGKKVFSLNSSALAANAKGAADVESRFNAVLEDVKRAKGTIILFVDELPHFLANDAGQKQSACAEAIRQGDMQLVGATTAHSYQETIATDAGLARQFERVVLSDANGSETAESSADQDTDNQSDQDASASPGEKLSADLQDVVQHSGDRTRVKVILQVDKMSSEKVNELLSAKGVEVKNRFRQFGLIEVELPVGALKTLASSTNVKHVSLNRSVKGFANTYTYGALANTVGASVTGLDGSGIGIAILDSGI